MADNTFDVQRKLADFVKTGVLADELQDYKGRLSHYRRLVFNVHYGILSQAFPIAQKVLGDKWRPLIDEFLAQSESKEEEVWKMPRLLFDYVQVNPLGLKNDYPWIEDLLLFEWTEIEIHAQPNVETPKYQTQIDTTRPLVINPYLKILQLQYPVHRDKIETCEKLDKPIPLAVARDNQNRVRFSELNSFSLLILEAMQEGHSVLDIAKSMGNGTLDSKLESSLLQLSETLQKQSILLGSTV